ncbi:putative arginine n-methyltransferase [Rhizoclosmatium globosum]|uniref:type I protein arginine methyltransferase n=1 Tax=Rhizoclosmatium globosum TaxID=329046 RepID=A0A1Y2CK41_9FUNG|nr:putative arginine n-methyltransferase [Rhizoclosmatium globosum]|eukprot:ORY47346.1 putative arginine n-methyltransferase [Rhizoclosmatium globosum]
MGSEDDDKLRAQQDFEDDNDHDVDEWIEDDTSTVVCLFCAATSTSIDDTLKHLNEAHHFDLVNEGKTLGLDFYEGIRLVNYIRKQVKENASFKLSSVSENTAEWIKDDAYLIPVIENDPLLYAIDFDDDDDDEQSISAGVQKASLETDDKKKIEALERQLAELKSAFSDYKELVRKTFLEDSAVSAPLPKRDAEGKESWEMDYYFGSYAETEIHETMLKDVVRTESYRDCFYLNKDFFKDKIVLDVGCGTGILSMFAAKAGAKHVYAVDNSTIILRAKEIVKQNGLADKITFIRGEVENISLPVDKVDCIVSEWMGYFLLFEGMFDSVITARDRWLADDGIMAPSHANILLAGLEDAEWINDKYNFWNDLHEGNFLEDGQVDFANPKSIITEPVVLKELVLDTVTPPELDFVTPFTLKFTKQSRVHGLCGWFDIRFEFPGPNSTPIYFSTSAAAIPTHWKQTTFVLAEPVDVNAGDVLEGTFDCKKSKENARELDVLITYVHPITKEKKSQKFTVR